MVDNDVAFLHAAADPTRLAILRELSSEGPIRACELTSCCNVHQPTASHHLRVLREAGWVRAERHGTNITYKLCPDAAVRFGQIAGEFRPGVELPASARSFGRYLRSSRSRDANSPGRSEARMAAEAASISARS